MTECTPFFDEPVRQKQFEAWELNAEQRRNDKYGIHEI